MKAWEITKKDLALQLRDRRAFALLLAFPVFFIGILGLTTGKLLDLGDDVHKYRIAVVDEDLSDMSARVYAQLEKRDGIIVRLHPADEARKLVDAGTANAALFIGKKFAVIVDEVDLSEILDTTQGRLQQGIEGFDMRIEHRPTQSTTADQIRMLVFADTLRVVTPFVACRNNKVRNLLLRSKCAELDAERTGDVPPTDPAPEDGTAPAAAGDEPTPPAEKLEPQPDPVSTPPGAATTATGKKESSPGDDVYQQLVPSYTVMFVFFLVNVMARSFIQERELGTLRRLRIAPIRPTSLLLGKTLPFLFLSLLQSLTLFLCGKFLFGMSWGPQPWLLIPVAACTSLAATSLGLLVATLVRTDSQVSAYANIVVILMAGISGCFMPREWLPETMREISLATPHAWALIAYDTLLKSANPNVPLVVECCTWMVGFSAAYFVVGSRCFAKLD